MTNGKQKQTWFPLIFPKFYKYKNIENLARTLSLFSIFSEIHYKSENEKHYDRTLLWRMIYNDKLWQSINETNQKNQSTYSFAGQKLTVNSEYIAY